MYYSYIHIFIYLHKLQILQNSFKISALAKECATTAILEEEEDWVLVKNDIPSITF